MKKFKIFLGIVIAVIVIAIGFLFNHMNKKEDFVPLDEYNERYSNEAQQD